MKKLYTIVVLLLIILDGISQKFNTTIHNIQLNENEYNTINYQKIIFSHDKFLFVEVSYNVRNGSAIGVYQIDLTNNKIVNRYLHRSKEYVDDILVFPEPKNHLFRIKISEYNKNVTSVNFESEFKSEDTLPPYQPQWSNNFEPSGGMDFYVIARSVLSKSEYSQYYKLVHRDSYIKLDQKTITFGNANYVLVIHKEKRGKKVLIQCYDYSGYDVRKISEWKLLFETVIEGTVAFDGANMDITALRSNVNKNMIFKINFFPYYTFIETNSTVNALNNSILIFSERSGKDISSYYFPGTVISTNTWNNFLIMKDTVVYIIEKSKKKKIEKFALSENIKTKNYNSSSNKSKDCYIVLSEINLFTKERKMFFINECKDSKENEQNTTFFGNRKLFLIQSDGKNEISISQVEISEN